MRLRSICWFVAGALLAGAPVARAAGPDLKPGLWERTVTMQSPMPAMAGMPELDRVPPEQRAQLEKLLATMAGKPTILRECVTPEMLAKWDDFARERTEQGCTSTVKEQTPQRVVMALSCEGGKSTGTLEFNVKGREQMTGTISMVHTAEDGARHMKINTSSRWLNADCGNIKPDAPIPMPQTKEAP
jgi:hypothetical protein